jgi:hypothetical protein
MIVFINAEPIRNLRRRARSAVDFDVVERHPYNENRIGLSLVNESNSTVNAWIIERRKAVQATLGTECTLSG